MKSDHLKQRFSYIETEINDAIKISQNDPKLAARLSSYLVVIISGIYEDAVEHLFEARASKTNDEEIKRLVSKLIKEKFRNPKYENIMDLVKGLDQNYSSKFAKISSKCRDSINSIVSNRQQVAHQGTSSSATLNDIKQYHKNAKKIFEIMEGILL